MEPIYNTVLTSDVQQRDSVVYIHTILLKFFSIVVYPEILTIAPWALQ